MSRSTRHRKNAVLQLEYLEDRCVPNVAWAPPDLSEFEDPRRLLVAYREQGGAFQEITLDANTSSLEALEKYGNDPNVLFAEIDYTLSIDATPNDPRYSNGSLYGLNKISAPTAWDTTTGSFSVSVGVIDTGIDYTHQDLYRNIWINQDEIPTAVKNNLTDVDGDGLYTFFDLNDSRNQGAGKITDLNNNGYIDGGDILRSTAAGGWADGQDQDSFTAGGTRYSYVDDLVGWDWVNDDNNPYDDNAHGTHVAGTIGAIGNNSTGVVGVNWKVQMAALKFLSRSGSGSTSDAVRAIHYSIGNGIAITNNSWGGGGSSQAMFNAIQAAGNAGQIFVAAAGNSGVNTDSRPHYPSSYNLSNIISVAATDSNDRLANFSNYGRNTVDLAAPGVGIVSTTPGNNYRSFSGTSMAAPHVAGVVALVKASNSSLTSSQIISKVLNSVDTISGLNGDVATGGRLNAAEAVKTNQNPPADTTGPMVLTAVPNATGTNPVSSVRVTFNEAIKAGTFTTADISSFSGPSGSVSVTNVKAVGTTGKVFDVVFSQQTSAGNYSFRIGPNIEDLKGNLMNQDGDSTNGESVADQFEAEFSIKSSSSNTYTNDNDARIRDRRWTVSRITINDDLKITDVNVRVNIEHTYDRDLYIYVRSPDRTTRLLVRRRGGSGDNFTNTLLDDEATTLIRNGRAPFNGSFRPEQSLSVYDGKSSKGTWQLWIFDAARRDIGTLKSWSLIITGESQAGSASVGEDLPTDAPINEVPAAPPVAEPTTAPTQIDAFGNFRDSNLIGVVGSSAFVYAEAVPFESPAPEATGHDTFRLDSLATASTPAWADAPVSHSINPTPSEDAVLLDSFLDEADPLEMVF